MQSKLTAKTTGTDTTAADTTASAQTPEDVTFEEISFTAPTNSENEADDEQEDDVETNKNTSTTISDVMLFDVPTNSDEEMQDDDVDQSILELMTKQQEMYVIRKQYFSVLCKYSFAEVHFCLSVVCSYYVLIQ